MKAWRWIRAAVAAALLCAVCDAVTAAEQPWVIRDHSRARLVAMGPSPDDPETLLMGIHLRLQAGWETYWRTPGDAGMPPEFYFDDTDNVEELYVDWPLPERKVVGGMTTYVYRDDVLLPITVYPSDRTLPVKLRLHIVYAVCRDVCTLEEADLALDAMASERDERIAALFQQHAPRMPIVENRPDIAIDKLEQGIAGGRRYLDIAVRASTPWDNPDVIIEGPPGFVFKPAAVVVNEQQGRRVTLRAEYTHTEGKALAPGEEVLVTVFDRSRAIERLMTLAPP